jgi:hypothetical protein
LQSLQEEISLRPRLYQLKRFDFELH